MTWRIRGLVGLGTGARTRVRGRRAAGRPTPAANPAGDLAIGRCPVHGIAYDLDREICPACAAGDPRPLLARAVHTESGRTMVTKAADNPDWRSLRVLIVDDDTEMRALLRRALEGAGHRVIERGWGDEVVAAVRDDRCDAIVLDNEMPGLRGIELLPMLRHVCPGVPVVFVTAFGGDDVRRRAMGLGAARYLEKPFRLATLLDSVLDVALGPTPA